LRLLNEDAENGGRTFPDVLGGDRDAFWREVVGLDEVADRFAQTGAKSVLVRAARRGRDAIDVRAEVLVGRLGPLKHEIAPRAGPIFFSPLTAFPCLKRISHCEPSRLTVATSSFDSALTTLAPTPCSPPAVL